MTLLPPKTEPMMRTLPITMFSNVVGKSSVYGISALIKNECKERMLSLIIFNALFLRKGDLFLLDGELTKSIRSASTTVCAVKSTEENACRTGGDVCQPQGATISS